MMSLSHSPWFCFALYSLFFLLKNIYIYSNYFVSSLFLLTPFLSFFFEKQEDGGKIRPTCIDNSFFFLPFFLSSFCFLLLFAFLSPSASYFVVCS